MKALPFVTLSWPVTAAFLVSLDDGNRPVLRCVIAKRSHWGLIADASVAAAGLTLSTPQRPSKSDLYLLRLSTNFGFTWVQEPPRYPLLAACPDTDGSAAAAIPKAPKPANRVNPKYPAAALQEEMEGQVDIWLDVFSSGTASPVCIAGGIPPGWFEQAALDAVTRWRFAPQDGMGRYRITVKFRLE